MTSMSDYLQSYSENLSRLLLGTVVTDRSGNELTFDRAVEEVTELFISRARSGPNKIMFVGNGGSAGIVSHQVFDYWKNGGLRAVGFNDPASLTGSANDFGYANVFSRPLAVFAQEGDVLVAISSSGQSANIVNAAIEARKRRSAVVTLSAFSEDNPLRRLGDWNFYVPSHHYGLVEVAHLAISHSFLDYILAHKTPGASPRRIIGRDEVTDAPRLEESPETRGGRP
ncbi:SIS domain-containing protein [Patescibacteria group bacterium]|nr:MAG: SIS domain-containing protein [Patescibacteria group bacterium]